MHRTRWRRRGGGLVLRCGFRHLPARKHHYQTQHDHHGGGHRVKQAVAGLLTHGSLRRPRLDRPLARLLLQRHALRDGGCRRGCGGLLLDQRPWRHRDHVQVLADLRRALITQFAIRLHRLQNDRVETRIGAHLCSRQRPHAARDFACQHLKQHHAYRIQVRASVHHRAGRQRLRSHKIRRAHRHVRLRQPAESRVALLRQAEVGHLHRTLHVDQNVRWLDVAVNHPARVRILQRVAHMGGDGQGIILRQPALRADHLGHVRAVDEFHHNEQQPGLRLPEVPQVHDRRVVHLRHRARLVLEALGELRVRIVDQIPRQHLDGHHAVQGKLHRLVNRPHAALAEQRYELVLRQHGLHLLQRRRLPALRRFGCGGGGTHGMPGQVADSRPC